MAFVTQLLVATLIVVAGTVGAQNVTCAVGDAACCRLLATFNPPLLGTSPYLRSVQFGQSITLSGDPQATYSAGGSNCGSYFYVPYNNSYIVTNNATNNATVLTHMTTNSNYVIVGNTLQPGLYFVNYTAWGPLPTQVTTLIVPLIVTATTPFVVVDGPARASVQSAFEITASVFNPVAGANVSWTCVFGCPTTLNTTSTSVNVAANTVTTGNTMVSYSYVYANPVGNFGVVSFGGYTVDYNSIYLGGLVTVAVTAAVVPVVALRLVGGIVNHIPNVFGSGYFSAVGFPDTVSLVGDVTYPSDVTLSWSVNYKAYNGTGATLAIPARTLSLTTTNSITWSSYLVLNTITLTATSTTDATVYNSASVSFVVLQNFTTALSIAKQGSSALSAAYGDSLVFTPTWIGNISETDYNPFNSTFSKAIVYYTLVDGVEAAVPIDTTVSGSVLVGAAPNVSATSDVTFGVQLLLNGALVASANSTFTINPQAEGGCAAASTYNVGLFSDNVPWACVEPFDCFIDFCSCVNGSMGSSCTPFGDVNVSTIEQCTARRVTCTLKAALNSRNVWNTSCQAWGDNLAALYATYYDDRSFTNLTNACLADVCDLIPAGNSVLASAVNYTAICTFDVDALGAPVDRDEVAGCAAPTHTYFDTIPVAQCSGAANCSQVFCGCVGGTWAAATLECTLPAAQPSEAVLESCLGAAVSCLTNAALDVYVPGASPLNTDVCQQWAVPISQDYAAYYNATRPNATVTVASTLLWKACNYTACKDVYKYNHSASYATACTFAAVNRTPNFVAYNACPYSCPDTTCAANLASCACTANAAITNLTAVANVDLTSVTTTTAVQLSAAAAYAVASGNCSNYTFGSSLSYTWRVANAAGSVVLSMNGSTLSVTAGSLAAGVYNATVTAAGLLAAQRKSLSMTLTVVAPEVVIVISGLTLVSNKQAFALKATITNAKVGGVSLWTCAAGTTTCPSITNATTTTLYVPATPNATAGTVTFGLTYFWNASNASAAIVAGTYKQVSYRVTFTSAVIPLVTMSQTISGSIASTTYGLNVFTNNQRISVAGVVQFTGTYTLNWTVNGVAIAGNLSTVSFAASLGAVTTLASAKAGTYTQNNVTLTATSTADNTIYGTASVTFYVLEPISVSLSVGKQGSADTSATSLTDTLAFVTTAMPTLTTSTVPFGASLDTSIVYYTILNGTESSAKSLLTTVSGSSRTAKAPLFPDTTVTSQAMKFGVQVSIAGVVVATANTTFTIVRGSVTAAATSVLSSVSSITDPSEAVDAMGNIGTLAESGDASVVAQMVTAGLALMASTISNTTQLSATQATSAVSAIGTLLSHSANKSAATKQVLVVFVAVISGTSFNTDVASSVGSAIGNMDAASAGSVAGTLMLAWSALVPVGESAQLDMGAAGAMTSTSATGADLAGKAVTSAYGAAVTLPSGFLSMIAGAEDAVYGIATVVLLVSPYETSGPAPTGGVITQDVTAGGSSVPVAGLSEAIVIKMPTGTTGDCRFYDTVTSLWSADGVTTVVTTTGIECHTIHLTPFAGVGSSAAAAAISALVVVLAALLQLYA